MPPYFRVVDICLHERVVKPVDLFPVHADTRVRNAGLDPLQAVAPPPFGLQPDDPALGELAGVAQQIEEHLAHPGFIGHHVASLPAFDFQPVGVLIPQRANGPDDV